MTKKEFHLETVKMLHKEMGYDPMTHVDFNLHIDRTTGQVREVPVVR